MKTHNLSVVKFILLISLLIFLCPMPAHAKGNYELLSFYTTKFDTSQSRATNVRVAASRINGVTINPNETFSFNIAILPRTTENGYVNGPQFIGGKTVNAIGGGICQVSSTLYASLLGTGVEIVERHPHGKPVTYIPKGMDATISGNILDLKFRNTYNRPIMIATQIEEESGTLIVALWIKE